MIPMRMVRINVQNLFKVKIRTGENGYLLHVKRRTEERNQNEKKSQL